MNRDQKAAAIDEIAGEIEESQAIFAVDYRGISVPQAAELRVKLSDANATFRVVKNSLTERAADRTGAEQLKELLQGPTALTFVRGDAALAAKAVADYARATSLLPFKGGLMGGEPLTAQEIGQIARLPARDVLYGQLVGLVASPIGGLVRTLNALIGGLAIQLGAIAEKKASGELPAGDPPAAAEGGSAAASAAADEPPAAEPAASQGGSAAEDSSASADDPVESSEESPADAPGAEAEVAPAEEAPAEVAEEPAPAQEQPAAEAAEEEKAAPEQAPAENDNQADASADADDHAAEAKEDQ